jgi:PAS domain S-box-containing protein
MPKISSLRRGLKGQIVWSFLFTVIVILNVAAWFFYSRARDYFDSELGKTLIGLAKSGSDLIDADLLEFLRPGYERGGFYQELQSNLEILKKDFNVHRLFIIDKRLKTLLDTDLDSPIGHTPTHLQINLIEVEAALKGAAVYSTLYRSHDGNLYKSAYSPVFDKQGHVVAVVCVDASPTFLHVIDRITNLIVTLNLVSIVVAIIISLILARSILKPVQRLVAAARRVSHGNFSQPVQIASKNEIGFLAQVFNSMQENIKAKEEHLEKLKKVAEGKAESIQSYNDYILSSITHGILTFDLQGTMTIINPAAEKILQLSQNHSTGKKYSEVFGEDHPFSPFIKRALQSVPRRTRKEIEIILPESKRILSAEVSPLIDSKQETIGINFVITDLTEIRKLQNEIREKERLAYLGELSATIAHEVRNPLNSIELFVGLLKRRINDQREREDAINKIQQEIRTLNAFISDFLMFARPIELKMKSIPLSKLFQEVLFLAWKDLQDKHIDVRVNLPEQKLRIHGDFDQLKRAFLNVVLNAVQAMETSGTLTLAAMVDKLMKKIQIEIADTGSGIKSEDYDRIFQPFYSTRSQGTGLGLAIVRNIITAHHGTIIVQNNDPKGAKFIFYL